MYQENTEPRVNYTTNEERQGSDMTALLTHDHCKKSLFISVFKCWGSTSLVSFVLRGPFLQSKTQIKIELFQQKNTKKTIMIILIFGDFISRDNIVRTLKS